MAKNTEKPALSFEATLAQVKKKYGSNTLAMASSVHKVDRIPTGIPGLDFALGGGVPAGRIIHIAGDQHCIDADTHVMFNVYDRDGNIIDSKGSSIRLLHDRFHGVNADRHNGRAGSKHNSIFMTSSVDTATNRLRMNEIVDVISCGKRECMMLKTYGGKTLVCTTEHAIYCPRSRSFINAGNMSVGDILGVLNSEYTKFSNQTRVNYREILVKKHSGRHVKLVDKKYVYYRVKLCNAIIEAKLNGMELDQYIQALNTESWHVIDQLHRIPEGSVVHHLDGNRRNDDPSNLVMLPEDQHRSAHMSSCRTESFCVSEDVIFSIVHIGTRDTFDIKCASPFNSFIANRIVVHNSGKTYLAKKIIASIQQYYTGQMCFLLDAERSYDPIRANHIGVDENRLLICRPAASEQGLDEMIEMIPHISCAAVDSVAALSSVAEMEGTMSDKQVGAVAAMMSKFFHKWISETAPEKLASGIVPTLLLTNQLRDDIGAFVKKTKTPGGRGMLHYPSVFIELSRGPVVKIPKQLDAEDEEIIIGHDVKFKIKKNNTFQPDKVGSFMLCTRPHDFGGYALHVNQVDWPRDLLKYAAHYGVVKKNGNWYEFPGGQTVNGKLAAQILIYNDGMVAGLLYELTLKEVRIQHGIKADGDQEKVEASRKAGGKATGRSKSSWVRK